jgi:hypothetical protein
MEPTIPPPPEIHNFLGPAEPPKTSQAEPTSEAPMPTPGTPQCAVKDPAPEKENQTSTPQGGTPTLGALQSQAPLVWQAASLSLHLGTTPPVTKPPLDVATFADSTRLPPPNQAFLAALQAGRATPPGASHPLAVRALPHAETVSIRLTEPKTELGGFLFPPQSLPAAHSARFMTSPGGARPAPSKRQGLSHERSPLEKNLAADPEVRDIIDALVVERLHEFTKPGRFMEACCSGDQETQPPSGGASEGEGSGQAQGNLSDREASVRAKIGEWLANPVSQKEEERGVKKEPARSRDSDVEGGRKKRARSRSRSSSPHEAQGGHDRYGVPYRHFFLGFKRDAPSAGTQWAQP